MGLQPSSHGGLWDDHPACRTCMRKTGLVSSKSKPCRVCRNWSEALWTKVYRQAEIRSAKCRFDQAELHLSGMKAQTGMAQVLMPSVGDKAGVASSVWRDPRFEAPHGSMASYMIPRLTTASSTASFCQVTRVPHCGARPQHEVRKAGGESQLYRAPARSGGRHTSDGAWLSFGLRKPSPKEGLQGKHVWE